MTLKLTKQCPRCSSYLTPNRDKYGNYLNCVSCGYYKDIDHGIPIERNSLSLNTDNSKSISTDISTDIPEGNSYDTTR